MVSYEINSGAIKHSNPPSGSRTLLRLHRALEFVSMFFHRLAVVDFKEKMTSLAQDCYEQTLSKHHGFLVRKVCPCLWSVLYRPKYFLLKMRPRNLPMFTRFKCSDIFNFPSEFLPWQQFSSLPGGVTGHVCPAYRRCDVYEGARWQSRNTFASDICGKQCGRRRQYHPQIIPGEWSARLAIDSPWTCHRSCSFADDEYPIIIDRDKINTNLKQLPDLLRTNLHATING